MAGYRAPSRDARPAPDMPQLNTVRETVTIPLIAVEGGSITAYKRLLAADMDKITQNAGADGRTGIITMLVAMIKEWNLDGPDGQRLPVNTENVGLLDARDVGEIVKAIGLGEDFLTKGAAPIQ